MSSFSFPTRTSFAGHESFTVRYGWLKKGFDAITDIDPALLSSDEAMVELGVGKNMVRAIRHWGMAFRVWEPDPDGRGAALRPTRLGERLLGKGGWDPFVDEVGSAWLLHTWLVGEPWPATMAWYFFARPKLGPLRKAEIVKTVVEELRSVDGIRVTASSTIERDYDVALRLYASPRGADGEEALDSPLTALELIHPMTEPGAFALTLGNQPSLPSGVFAAYFRRWWERERRVAVPFDEVRHAPGSPGRVFRLTENALMDRLGELGQWMPGVTFDETAGIRQLLIQSEPPTEEAILQRHFTGTV